MRGADTVICNSEELRAYYAAKYPSARFAAVTNSYDPDDYDGISVGEKAGNHIVISHFGELYPTIRTPDAFLSAVAAAVREDPRVKDLMRIDFYGSTEYVQSGAFKELVDRLDLEPLIRCFGYVPHDEVLVRMMETDALLLLQPHRSTNYQIPAKLFEYIASGKPVLAIAPHGSATSGMMRRNRLGTVCDPDDEECMRRSIAAALEGMLPVPERSAVDKFSARHMAAELVNIIDAL
jgi:glycosyltransferase involved in cell wall biosynthesis